MSTIDWVEMFLATRWKDLCLPLLQIQLMPTLTLFFASLLVHSQAIKYSNSLDANTERSAKLIKEFRLNDIDRLSIAHKQKYYHRIFVPASDKIRKSLFERPTILSNKSEVFGKFEIMFSDKDIARSSPSSKEVLAMRVTFIRYSYAHSLNEDYYYSRDLPNFFKKPLAKLL